MSESINVENKKQNRQKPPLSVGRIAGEILAGLALGFVLLLVVYVTGIKLMVGPTGSMGQDDALFFLMIFSTIFSPLYGFGSAVGVYLVGTRGKQTGSFLLTLAGGFVGAFGMSIPSFILFTSGKVILYLPLLLLLLIPPGMATLGFNLLRRYKEPPSS